VQAVQAALAPWAAKHMYLNFADTQQDAATFWTERAYHRLRRIKTAVDPDDLIRSNHPIRATLSHGVSAELEHVYREFLAAKPARLADFEAALLPGAPKDRAPVPEEVAHRYEIEDREVAGYPVQILHPRQGGSGIQAVYFHGGGYTLPFLPLHWTIVAGLADRTGADLWVPHYALSPDATVDDALPFIDALAVEVPQAAGARRYIVSGESAGGNMALVQALRARENGTRLPDHLVIHAPWVDLRTCNPKSREMEAIDALQVIDQLQRAGRNWAGTRETTDPMVSPLFGDLSGLPPITVLQGTNDLLLPDVLVFVDRARQQGANVELELVEGAFHVYIGVETPESHRSLDLAAERFRG
jgi:acetyl esterase/lipase